MDCLSSISNGMGIWRIYTVYIYIGGPNFDECTRMSWQITHAAVQLPLCGLQCILTASVAVPEAEMLRGKKMFVQYLNYLQQAIKTAVVRCRR